jgi:hypothetical protein
MADGGSFLDRARELLESRTGLTVQPTERIDLMEAVVRDYRAQSKELDLLGYTVLDYFGGNPQEVSAVKRRQWSQKARMVWLQDPQAGAAVDLMNDFTSSAGACRSRAPRTTRSRGHRRGVGRPRQPACPDQLRGAGGARHRPVASVQRLPADVRRRRGRQGQARPAQPRRGRERRARPGQPAARPVLPRAHNRPPEWDYRTTPKVDSRHAGRRSSRPTTSTGATSTTPRSGRPSSNAKPSSGEGRVYHVAINRTSEQAFGTRRCAACCAGTRPTTTSWPRAWTWRRPPRRSSCAARSRAPQSGGEDGRQGDLARSELAGVDRHRGRAAVPPRGGSILTENENVTHENLNAQLERGRRRPGRADDPRGDLGGHALPAVLLRRRVQLEPRDRDVAGASGAQGRRGAPGGLRGCLPLVRSTASSRRPSRPRSPVQGAHQRDRATPAPTSRRASPFGTRTRDPSI